MSEFTPTELDALEDALEHLETSTLGDLPPSVQARLADYASLLAWTRDALPMEDVRPGVLDAVMREAESGPAASAIALPVVDAHARPPWWRRWVALLALPGLAVAGTAALALWVIRVDTPNHEATVATAKAPQDLNATAFPAAPSPVAPSVVHTEAPSSEPVLDAEMGLLAEAPAEVAPREDSAYAEEKPSLKGEGRGRGALNQPLAAPQKEARRDVASRDASKTRPRAPAGAPSKADAPAPPPSPSSRAESSAAREQDDSIAEVLTGAPSDAPKSKKKSAASDPGWDVLAHADGLRRKGNCGTARAYYQSLSRAESASIRARAFAGLGLCAAAAKQGEAAEAYFAQARELDTAVGRFIRAEGDAKTVSKDAK